MFPGRSIFVFAAIVGIVFWGGWVLRRRPPAQRAARMLLVAGWAAAVAGLVYSNLPFQSLLLHDLRAEEGFQRFYIQPVPGKSIYEAFSSGYQTSIAQVVANAMLLVPGGALLAGLVPPARRSPRFGLTLALGLGLVIEGSQFLANVAYGFLWKIVDVDDLLLNATGFFIAWMLYIRTQTADTKRSTQTTIEARTTSNPISG